MNRILVKLAIAGGLGCAALAVCQQMAGQMRQKEHNGETLAQTSDGKKYRLLTGDGMRYDAPPLNTVQEILVSYIIGRQNQLIEEQPDNSKRVSRIILVCNESMLTVMTPLQQKHQLYDVCNIDLWKPGPDWEALAYTPILAKTILELDSATLKKVDNIRKAYLAKMMKPITDLTNSPEFKALSQEEQAKRLREAGRQTAAGRTKYELVCSYMKVLSAHLQTVRSALNPTNRKEFDEIIERSEARYKQATSDAPLVFGRAK